MRPAELQAETIEVLHSLDPSFITWNGRTLRCVATSVTNDDALRDGGFMPDADVIFYVTRLQLGAATPRLNELVTYEGQSYRIDRIIRVPGDSFVKLVCVHAVQ